MNDDADWERWRGKIDEQLNTVNSALKRFEAKLDDVTRLKIKVGLISGGVVLVCGIIIETLLGRLIGQQ